MTKLLFQIISAKGKDLPLDPWQGFVFDDCKQKLIRRKDSVNLGMDKAEVFRRCTAKTEREQREVSIQLTRRLGKQLKKDG